MKNVRFLTIGLTFFVFANCGNGQASAIETAVNETEVQNNLEERENLSFPKLAFANESTHIVLDTFYNDMFVDGNPYSMFVFRDTSNIDREWDSEGTLTPLFLVITDNDDYQKVLFSSDNINPDDSYITYSFPKYSECSKELEKQYFKLRMHGGGSGSSFYEYLITQKDSNFDIILANSTSSIDFKFYHENDNEFLILSGVWGEGESHYGEHRYEIYTYRYNGESFVKELLGTTKQKYTGTDTNKSESRILMEMFSAEPTVFKGIDVLAYL